MQEETTVKYLIIGAGLSGLTSAYLLNKQGETDFVVLEARDRIGGRILTKDTIDFGATWIHEPHYHTLSLLEDLGIDTFTQYSKGKGILIYNPEAAPHYFLNDPNAPSSYRISGGSTTLIHKLSENVMNHIQTETIVSEIKEISTGISVTTNKGVYYAEKVIVALPPRMTSTIVFSPLLPETTVEAMKQTHTWMSNAIKVGINFKKAFWRDKELSGAIIGQAGPFTELYDHSNIDNTSFALMGFVNERLRVTSPEERKQSILDHLAHCLGEESLDYVSYDEKDWSKDPFTSGEQVQPVYLPPHYGNPVFAEGYMNGKLLLSGSETSPVHGGYMEGAIYSGMNAVGKLV